MLYAWVQGYVSAANIALLEDDGKHVDMSAFDDGKVLNLVLGFCKANPDKKPVDRDRRDDPQVGEDQGQVGARHHRLEE